MEDPLPFASIINNYHEKLLLETMRELELSKKVNTELVRRLNIANRERDQAREELQILLLDNINNHNLNNNNNLNINNNNNNLVMFQQTTKANSSITVESNSISHVSSPAESLLFETASSSHHQELNNVVDVESARIDGLASGKVLPQKGKLVEAIMNAGPILQNLMFAGPTPTWENPPPLNSLQLNLPGGVNTCFFTSSSSSIVKRQRLQY